jgi:hypothetical protein
MSPLQPQALRHPREEAEGRVHPQGMLMVPRPRKRIVRLGPKGGELAVPCGREGINLRREGHLQSPKGLLPPRGI